MEELLIAFVCNNVLLAKHQPRRVTQDHLIPITSDNRRPRIVLPIAAVSLLMIRGTIRCFYLSHMALISQVRSYPKQLLQTQLFKWFHQNFMVNRFTAVKSLFTVIILYRQNPYHLILEHCVGMCKVLQLTQSVFLFVKL